MYILGRTIMKLGEESIPSAGFRQLPASVRWVLTDVFEHPGTSISQITARTGFPQSLVSTSVARLRDLGVMVTEADPADRRRTLAAPAPGMLQRAADRASDPVDATVARAMATDGEAEEAEVAEVLAALELLARYFTPQTLTQIRFEAVSA